MSGERRAIFISYASQDAEPAKRICDALREAGVEVWFDQSELRGGDAWDQKIRRQIKECALFVPIISANTQARREGYFRFEWRLATERMQHMDDELPFLVPVAIDGTAEPAAFVPDRFRTVQWTRFVSDESLNAFCERVQGLLSGDMGARTSLRAPPSGPRATATVPGKSARPRWAVLGMAAAIAFAALALWRPWRGAPPVVPTSPPATQSAAQVAQPATDDSSVSSLLTRARALLLDPNLTRAKLDAALQLCDRALALDPVSADAWALSSQSDTSLFRFNFDRSAARRESAQRKAAKALSLDGRSFEARLADAYYVLCMPRESALLIPAESSLRALMDEKPADWRAYNTLAHVLKGLERYEEAVQVLEKMAALPDSTAIALGHIAWVYRDMSRWQEMDDAAHRSVAAAPLWDNLAVVISSALHWRGDVELAKATLQRLPPAALQEDFGAAVAVATYLRSREPENVLRVLEAYPRDWLESLWSFGPKAYYTGVARQQLKRLEAARNDFQRALALVEPRLAESPNDARLLRLKFEILLALGDRAGAGRVRELHEQAAGATGTLANSDASPEQRITSLERTVEVGRRWLTAAQLKLDSKYDDLRAHPRFQALLARMEADPRYSPQTARPHAGRQTAEDRGQMPEVRVQKSVAAKPPMDLAPAKSIAVLAFENLSGDKDNEYFSDGISEELLNVLAKVPGLRVAARTSAFYFKDRNATAQEIGQKLGVAHLVDGSVRRAGTKVRIAARLSKAETGEQVWGESYEKELKDVFALQDEIAALIAKNLELKLGGAPRATKTVNPEAHRLVLEGRHFWNLRNEEGFTKAEDAFKRALAIVHDFAAAHAGLAEVYAMRASYRAASGLAGVQTVRVEAERQARRALELDANLSEAHAVLGNVYGHEGKFAEAEKAFERAVATNPNNATARFWHAATLGEQGRLDLYLAEMQIAVAMDPLSFSAAGRLGNVLYWAQRHHDALAASDRAIALESGTFMSNRSSRAKILLALGRREEAVAAARLVRNSSGGTYRLNSDAAAIWVLRQCGHVEEATNYARDVLALPTTNTFVRSHVLAAMGRFDEALPLVTGSEGVERAMVLFWDPKWDPIRDDPRFHDAIAKLNRTREYKVARESLARVQNGGGEKK